MNVTGLDNRMDDGPSLRVLACCWGPGNPATTFVMLDTAGEVMSVLHTGYLNMRASSPEQKQRKENDQNRLIQFMREYQPHVCVLGAANLHCRHLSNTIFEVRMLYVPLQLFNWDAFGIFVASNTHKCVVNGDSLSFLGWERHL